MIIRPTALQSKVNNLFRFSVKPPAPGVYTFDSSSPDTAIDLGTYWGDPADHTVPLPNAFDIVNGFEFFLTHKPVYISATVNGFLQGIGFSAVMLDSSSNPVNLGKFQTIQTPAIGFSMIRDFSGTFSASSTFGGCIGFAMGLTLPGPYQTGNGIQFYAGYGSGLLLPGASVSIVVPSVMYYVGGALPEIVD